MEEELYEPHPCFCDHDWIDPNNAVIKSDHMWCRKCRSVGDLIPKVILGKVDIAICFLEQFMTTPQYKCIKGHGGCCIEQCPGCFVFKAMSTLKSIKEL
jgi:hypothetical protein